jgi:hypothetical protein
MRDAEQWRTFETAIGGSVKKKVPKKMLTTASSSFVFWDFF